MKDNCFSPTSMVILGLLGVMGSARAQSPASADATAAAGAAQTELAEVVVSAQRRDERLSDVPLAITALGGDDLARLHVTDMTRLQNATPGLTFGKQGSDFFPAIRGVRTQLVSVQSDPVVGFYIDEIYQSRVAQQSFPLFDIARVEVQRGPQGTLYGRNTFGGNVAVITQAPVDKFEAGFNAQGGNYSSREMDAFVNIPLSETVQLRVAAAHSEHAGYLRSSTTAGIALNDDNQSAVRASLRFKPSDKLEFLLQAALWDRNAQGGGAFSGRVDGTLINLATGLRSVNGSPVAVNSSVHNGSVIIAGQDVGVRVTGDKYTNQWDYKPFETLQEHYVSGQISYDFGPVTLKSITGVNSFNVDRSADLDQSSVVYPAAGVTAGFSATAYQAQNTIDHALSQELQLSSNGSGRVGWIAGAYYFNDKVLEYYRQVYYSPAAIAANTLGTRSRVELTTKSYAGYGQATFALVPEKLRLITGVRYSSDTKTYNITNQTAPAATESFLTQTAQVASGAPQFSKTTWRVGLEYNPTQTTMFYGTVSTGYESGGFNNNASNALIPGAYNPQTVTAFEVGSKSRFLDGRVSLDLSAFHNSYKDLQITVLDRVTNLSYTQSAGAARGNGLEVDFKTIPLAGLHLDLTAAMLDAKFTTYVRPNAFHVTGGDDGLTVDLAGKDVPMSPRLKTTLSAYYDVGLGAGVLTPRVSALNSTKYYATDYNTALDLQKAYTTLDASVRFTDASDRWYGEVYGDNLTNEAVLYSATLGNSARVQTSYGAPRLYGLRFGAKF